MLCFITDLYKYWELSFLCMAGNDFTRVDITFQNKRKAWNNHKNAFRQAVFWLKVLCLFRPDWGGRR